MLGELTVTIRGVCPMLMCNGQMADPLNKFVKQLKEATKKKSKMTDEERAEASRIEWHGCLYVNKDEKLILPSSSLEASIYDGAKKVRLGKAFKSAVFVYDDALLDIGVKYDKATDLWGKPQYRDVRAVVIGGKRIMRTRPIFPEWKATFTIAYDNEQVDLSDIQRALIDAGSKSGIGDFRPRFGRYEVVDR